MKRLLVCLSLLSLLVVSACQQSVPNSKTEKTVKEEERTEKEQSSTESVAKVDHTVPKGKEAKTVEEIKGKALYKWQVDEGVDLYLINDKGTIEEYDGNYAIGSQGERRYVGDVALYNVMTGEKNGYLQERLKEVDLNLDRAFSEAHDFNGGKYIAWIQPEASNIKTLRMWRYQDGATKRVQFDGHEEITVSNSKMKFLKDDFMQSYVYQNAESDDGGVGWYYKTWKWDEEQNQFKTFDEKQYTDDKPYGWETGEHITKKWHDNDAYYVPFPEITLTNKLMEDVKKGRLVEDGIHLGQSIDAVLAVSPAYDAHDYYEGGRYYSVPGPFTYFYNELGARGVTYITLSGSSLTNDLESVKEILGVPYSSYDESDEEEEMDFNYSLTYHIDDKQLRVEYNDDREIVGIWLSEIRQ